MSFETGMLANNKVTLKLYNAMSPGAKMGILCGNIRRNGKYHDMMLSLALPGEILQNIVKMQHNCVSNGRTYSRKNFVPIIHENLVILQKPCRNYLHVGYILPRKITMDIRDSTSATWRDVIRAVLYSLGKSHYTKIVESFSMIIALLSLEYSGSAPHRRSTQQFSLIVHASWTNQNLLA